MRLQELPAEARPKQRGKSERVLPKAEERARREIPLFLAMRALVSA